MSQQNTLLVNSMRCLVQEKVPVGFECLESSPAEVVSAIDQPPPQVHGPSNIQDSWRHSGTVKVTRITEQLYPVICAFTAAHDCDSNEP